MTAKALAKSLGVTPQYISNLINGRGNASMQMASRIAGVLGVSLDTLLGEQLDTASAPLPLDIDTTPQLLTCPSCGQQFLISPIPGTSKVATANTIGNEFHGIPYECLTVPKDICESLTKRGEEPSVKNAIDFMSQSGMSDKDILLALVPNLTEE